MAIAVQNDRGHVENDNPKTSNDLAVFMFREILVECVLQSDTVHAEKENRELHVLQSNK